MKYSKRGRWWSANGSGGMSFKVVLATLTALALASAPTLAMVQAPVPEVSSNGSLAAIVAVAALAAMIWERRRRS